MKSKLDPTIFYLLALFAVAVIAFSIFIPDIFGLSVTFNLWHHKFQY